MAGLQEIHSPNRRGRPRRFLLDHSYELPSWGRLTLVWVTVPMPEDKSYSRRMRDKWKEAGCRPDEMLVDIRLDTEGLRRLLKRAVKPVQTAGQPDLFGSPA